MSRILAIILFAFFCYYQNIYAQNYILRGKVVKPDYTPVKDVKIYIDDYPPINVIKANGEFTITISKDPKTIQNVRIDKKDFEYKSHKYRDKETIPLEIIIDMPNNIITGRVVYRNSKGVINGSVVFKGTLLKDSVHTDKLGYFKAVVFGKADINELISRGIVINGKEISKEHARANNNSFVQIRLVEDPPPTLYTIAVMDKSKATLTNVKMIINKIDYYTDNQGFIKTNTPDLKNAEIEIEGFKITDKQFLDNNFVEITVEKSLLPPPTSNKEREAALQNDQGKETEKAKQDTIRTQYFNEISTITTDIERGRKIFEEQNKKITEGIGRLYAKVNSDTSMTPEQANQIQREIFTLERTFIENDNAYKKSKEQTEDLISKLKEAILEKDSLGKKLLSTEKEKKVVEAEKLAIEKAKAEAEANFKTKLLVSSSALVMLSVLLIIVYVFTSRLNRQKKEVEQTRNELIEKVAEIELKNKQLNQTLDELKRAQAQMVSSEKMASLGQLTAGIAHEINNPVNFTYAGALSLKTDFNDLIQLLEQYRQITTENVATALPAAKNIESQIAYPEIKHEIDELLLSVKRGAERTAEIVKSLRTFARLDEDTLKKSDIEENIDATLVMLQSQFKERIEIVKKYGKIPPIECFPGQLNQVFMNMLLNAIQAIDGNGKITISTAYPSPNANGKYHGKEAVEISIKDTGTGMSEEVKENIFEPFFTTKDVGVGSGLGLSISFGIIEKHKGEIKVFSEVGKGTEFLIILPVTSILQNTPKQVALNTANSTTNSNKIQQV